MNGYNLTKILLTVVEGQSATQGKRHSKCYPCWFLLDCFSNPFTSSKHSLVLLIPSPRKLCAFISRHLDSFLLSPFCKSSQYLGIFELTLMQTEPLSSTKTHWWWHTIRSKISSLSICGQFLNLFQASETCMNKVYGFQPPCVRIGNTTNRQNVKHFKTIT